MACALRARSCASSASLPYSFGTTQKNQSRSHTIILGRVFPAYLPNGTTVGSIAGSTQPSPVPAVYEDLEAEWIKHAILIPRLVGHLLKRPTLRSQVTVNGERTARLSCRKGRKTGILTPFGFI
jgi:hypothetical protein